MTPGASLHCEQLDLDDTPAPGADHLMRLLQRCAVTRRSPQQLPAQPPALAAHAELQLHAHGGAARWTWQQWLNQPLVHAGCNIVMQKK